MDITPWLNELLFPVLLDVAFQQGNRADHLGEEQWLTLVIEDASVSLEEKLKQLGLHKDGLGGKVADSISQPGFGEAILSAHSRSDEEKQQRLLRAQTHEQNTRDARLVSVLPAWLVRQDIQLP
ncbi:hypothetical protein [Vreelandella massiliensis]|uniref:hypothetical protein n=1 Tax=Vreelandella massiliensis TaxID=1816686 RepID=UPI001181BDE6|nr:hypothetical protein [Halomonas massiliensis]